MEQVEKDLVSGAVDTTSKMETVQAQELLTKLEEHLAGYPEESRKIAVSSLMWMAERRKDEMREKEEKERAEQSEKRVEEESERRERARTRTMRQRLKIQWMTGPGNGQNRRRLEREGDEILEVLEKHEKKIGEKGGRKVGKMGRETGKKGGRKVGKMGGQTEVREARR